MGLDTQIRLLVTDGVVFHQIFEPVDIEIRGIFSLWHFIYAHFTITPLTSSLV